jgi:hypothetical protein
VLVCVCVCVCVCECVCVCVCSVCSVCGVCVCVLGGRVGAAEGVERERLLVCSLPLYALAARIFLCP